jgi:hypothetical protein
LPVKNELLHPMVEAKIRSAQLSELFRRLRRNIKVGTKEIFLNIQTQYNTLLVPGYSKTVQYHFLLLHVNSTNAIKHAIHKIVSVFIAY